MIAKPRWVCFVFLALVLSAVGRGVEINAVAGASYLSPSVNGSGATPSGKVGLAYGALLDFRLAAIVGLELGALHVNESFGIGAGSLSVAESFQSIQVPLLLRVSPLPFLSFGAGGYYSWGIGQVQTSVTAGSSTLSATGSFTDNSLTSHDYGLTASIMFTLPIVPKVHLLVDVRYLYGLQNRDIDSGASLYTREVQALAGLGISL